MPTAPSTTGGASAETHATTVQTQLILHYETIAYALVVTAYVFSFGEYLFLRLTYLLNPEKVTYHSTCQKRAAEIIGKSALNYGVVAGAFVAMAIFQIICFFGLTISEKWVKYRVGQESDPKVKLRKLLSRRIRSIMEATVYPTFLCYGIASAAVWMIIFYMFGIRDSIDELGSTISLYIFDALIVLYFIAFPLITYVYHPYLRRSAALAMVYATGVRNFRPGNQFGRRILPSGSSESQISQPGAASPISNPEWFVPPRSANMVGKPDAAEQPNSLPHENSRAQELRKKSDPQRFRRNSRLTSTV